MSKVSAAARGKSSSPAPDRIDDPDPPRSPLVMLMVDFVNPLDFPGADALAPAARCAGRACAASDAGN